MGGGQDDSKDEEASSFAEIVRGAKNALRLCLSVGDDNPSLAKRLRVNLAQAFETLCREAIETDWIAQGQPEAEEFMETVRQLREETVVYLARSGFVCAFTHFFSCKLMFAQSSGQRSLLLAPYSHQCVVAATQAIQM